MFSLQKLDVGTNWGRFEDFMILSESSRKVCVNIYFIGFRDGESAAPAEILLTKCPETTSTCPRVHLKGREQRRSLRLGSCSDRF